MSNITKKSALIVIVSCLIIVFTFSGCRGIDKIRGFLLASFLQRGYHEDICIPLETHEGEIIIREWTFLLGSGAEIYYKIDGKEIKLGQLPGGDDGYCPFQAGRYSVTVDGNILTIEWDDSPGGEYIPNHTETFNLSINRS